MDKFKNLPFAQFGIGFIGGLFAAFIVAGFGAFDLSLENHALLSSPFLSFLAFLLLLIIFHKPISMLLGRGSVTFKWGDKEIGFQEISEEFDKELGSRLEQLEERIDSIITVNSIKSQLSEQSITQTLEQSIKKRYSSNSDDSRKIIFHLVHTNYKWRNAETLVKKTGLPENEIKLLAREEPDIILGRSKSKKDIYRLADIAKRELQQS